MFEKIIKENLVNDKKAVKKFKKAGCPSMAAIYEKKIKASEEALEMIKGGMDEMEAYRISMGFKK